MSGCKPHRIKIKLIEEVAHQKGFPGKEGPQGPDGRPGKKGLQGDIGRQGYRGDRGFQGVIGDTGMDGHQGEKGPTGPPKTWWLTGDPAGDCQPFVYQPEGALTGMTAIEGGDQAYAKFANQSINRDPVNGDLLLSLADCSVCIFQGDTGLGETGGTWVSTDLELGLCLRKTDLESCLRGIKTAPDICSFSLTLNDCPPLFQGLANTHDQYQVVEIRLVGEIVSDLPVGTFTTADQLGLLLEQIRWQYTSQGNTYLYILTNVNVELTAMGDSLIKFQSVLNPEVCYSYDLSQFCQNQLCYTCQGLKQNTYLLSCLNQTTSYSSGAGSQTGPAIAWADPNCFPGSPGETGPSGAQGLPGSQGQAGIRGVTGAPGPSCAEVTDCLVNQLDNPIELLCSYCGLISCSADLSNPGSVGLKLVGSLVYSPLISYANPEQYQVALEVLGITINGNLILVSDQSSRQVAEVAFFNSLGQIRLRVPLELADCQKRSGGISPDSLILTRKGQTGDCQDLEWVSARCSLVPKFDLERQVAMLDTCRKYKCVLRLDTTKPFLGGSLDLEDFAIQVQEIILFDQDLTTSYTRVLNSYSDWLRLLKDHGWEAEFSDQTGLKTGIYLYCYWTDDCLTEQTINRYSLQEVGQSKGFYQEDLSPAQSSDRLEDQLWVLANDLADRTGSFDLTGCSGITGGSTAGFFLGFTGSSETGPWENGFTGACRSSPVQIMNSIPFSSQVCYRCSTVICPDQLVEHLVGGGVNPPWMIKELVVSGNHRSLTGVDQHFSTGAQLAQILLSDQLGFVMAEGCDCYQLTSVQPVPVETSHLVIGNQLDGKTVQVVFGSSASSSENSHEGGYVTCLAECQLDFTRLVESAGTGITGGVMPNDYYIFTRIAEGQYCWMNPDCFNQGALAPLLSDCSPECSGPSLDSILGCTGLELKFDLKLELNPGMIELISHHFCLNKASNVSLWIYGYLYAKTGQIQEVKAKVPIPFNLKNLVKTFESIGWQVVNQDLDYQGRVCLLLNDSPQVIQSVLINRSGEDGKNLPINFQIPLHTIERVECLPLNPNLQILLKNGVSQATGISECLFVGGGLTGAFVGETAGQTGVDDGNYCFVHLDCVIPKVTQVSVAKGMSEELSNCDHLICLTGVTGANGQEIELIQTQLTGTTGSCGICYYQQINVSGLGDEFGATGRTGSVLIRPCPGLAFYQNCLRVGSNDLCILQRYYAEFAGVSDLVISEYRLVGCCDPSQTGSDECLSCPLSPPVNLGQIDLLTLNELVTALESLGWMLEEPVEDPAKLSLFTCLNLRYLVIQPESNIGATGLLVVPPYLLNIEGVQTNLCPSNDPANQTLVRQGKNDCAELCWSPICPIPGITGDRGLLGVTGAIGLQGGIGGTGFDGLVGAQGDRGAQGQTGFDGFTGLGGILGSIGVQGAQGETGDQGEEGLIGFQGDLGNQGVTGPEGFQGELGPLGLQGLTGDQFGQVGVTGAQGIDGLQGFQGDTGVQEGQLFGLNLGVGEGQILFDVDGNNPIQVELRTLKDGENIQVSELISTICLGVRDEFDWSNTSFTGMTGAVVLDQSSLTFNDGSILFTNEIEETTDDNGVVIDTSSGVLDPGVTVKDGGMEFENNMELGVRGIVPRPLYLELYVHGSFETEWRFATVGMTSPSIGSTLIPYQRIGNLVTIYIPEITNTPETSPSGSSLISSVTPMPLIITSLAEQRFHITFDRSITAPANPDYVSTMLTISGVIILIGSHENEISPDLSGAAGFENDTLPGFTGGATGEYFSHNWPRCYSYYISNDGTQDGYCPS